MNVNVNNRRRRWIRRTAVAAALGVGTVVAPPAAASALSIQAFAYQVFDCSTPGPDFGVAAGTPDKPTGPLRGTSLAADAMLDDGTVVTALTLRNRPEFFDRDVRWATVEPGVDFDYVQFSFGPSDQQVIFKSPEVKPEVCDGPPTSVNSGGSPGSGLTPVTPVRLLDTRVKTQQATDPVAAGTTVRVKVNGTNGVPSNASAAMLNITAANPAAPGFLTVYSCEGRVPTASNLNYIAGETRAGSAFTRVGGSGDICVYTSAATSLVVDLNGYVDVGARPLAVDPIRVVDTRPGALTDVAGTPKGKQTDLKVPISKFGQLDGSDLILNITTVGADAPGHISVGGCDSDGRDAIVRSSVVNYVPGRAQANLAFVHVVEPTVCVAASASTHIIVDLVGVIDLPSGLIPGSPVYGRLADTRGGAKTSDGLFQGGGQLKANVPLKLKVRDRTGAMGATAAAFNITAVKESAYGHITVYPCGGTVPIASNLNYQPGTAIANVAFSALDGDGNVCIVSHVDTDLVVDLAAFNTTAILSDSFSAFEPTDFWTWSPVLSAAIWGQRADMVRSTLWGGAPPYSVTGPTVSGLAASFDQPATLVLSVAEGTYVFAEPTYTLSDADGNSQELKFIVQVDPQLYTDLFPRPVPIRGE